MWKIFENGGTQGIQFLIQLILARLLNPSDFGIIAIVLGFISISNIFVQSGLNTALIQKKQVTSDDFTSVFLLSSLLAFILYIILFISAPYIAKFYLQPKLSIFLRILSLVLFPNVLNSIQTVIIRRRMEYKKLFISSVGAILVSGVIGIILAIKGAGLWSLVILHIVNQFMVAIIMCVTVKWRPKLLFSSGNVRQLFSYGWKLLVAGLLESMYKNSRSLIIGKLYLPAALSYYNRGEQFPSILVNTINGSFQSVILPILSSQQEDLTKIRETASIFIKTTSFIIFWMLMSLVILAEPLVIILLTEKWRASIPFVQIFCVAYMFIPINTANIQAINSIGRSDIYLKIQVIKKIIGIAIIALTCFFGVYAIAIGQVIYELVSVYLNAIPVRKLINYKLKDQIKDSFPAFFSSCWAGFGMYIFGYLNIPLFAKLVIQITISIIIYIGISYICNKKVLVYIKDIIYDSCRQHRFK